MSSWPDDIDAAHDELRAGARQTIDYGTLPTAVGPVMTVEVPVTEQKAAEILQAHVGPGRLPSLSDGNIREVITMYFERIADSPVPIDLEPYRRRLQSMGVDEMPPPPLPPLQTPDERN